MLFLNRSQLAEARPRLIAIWNAVTDGQLPLEEPLWLQNVENDPLFQDGDCLVHETGRNIAGFAITRMLTQAEIEANPDMADSRTRGHIMALAVNPQHQWRGIGSGLLAAAEQRLREMGATTVALWGPPGHLVPGPMADYGDRRWWRRRGYEQGETSVDLHRTFDDWKSPPPPSLVASGQYTYRQGQPGEEGAILEFLHRAFPGRWPYETASAFKRGYRPEDVTLLVEAGGKIQGFLCSYHADSGFIGNPVHWYPIMREGVWGGMGPLGISGEIRGGGLGLGLVAAGADYLYSRGVRDCAIDWTGLVDFYGRLGFKPWKSYLMLEKKLT